MEHLLILSVAGLGSFIAGLGIEQIGLRELIKEPHNRGTLLGTAFIVRTTDAVLPSAGLIVSSILVANNNTATLLIALMASAYSCSSFNILNVLFQSDVQSRQPTIVSIVSAFILAIGRRQLFLSFVLPHDRHQFRCGEICPWSCDA